LARERKCAYHKTAEKARGGIETSETRYFISGLSLDAPEIARAIRGHWMVESHHWHLDVTFREDADHTLNKHIA